MRADAPHANRVDRVTQVLMEKQVDALFVTPSADLQYLTGYSGRPSERPTVLAVTPGRVPIMVVPQLEAPRLQGRDDVEIRSYGDGDDPYQYMQSFLRDASQPARIGITDQAWSSVLLNLQTLFPTAAFVPASLLMRELRMVKDQDELALLHEAGRRADRAFEDLLRVHFAGLTEIEVSEALNRVLSEAGLARADWGPIVASGPNAASPHHITGTRHVLQGDAVVLDFGGVYDGYQADITRTVHVGPPDSHFKEVYATVVEAQQSAFEASRPGNTAGEVDRAARELIEEAGFGPYFVHRTGHGLGLDTHEEPYLVSGNTLRLEPGMAFSVEPGVYVPGRFGVRVEDTVAVYEDGPQRFNRATRELQIVG